jgi:hypothetical protein
MVRNTQPIVSYNVRVDISLPDNVFEGLFSGDHRLFRVALEIPVSSLECEQLP